jgi:hypothetical protein
MGIRDVIVSRRYLIDAAISLIVARNGFLSPISSGIRESMVSSALTLD